MFNFFSYKKFFFIVLVLLWSQFVQAQFRIIFFGAGEYCSFKMTDLMENQKDLISGFLSRGIPVKIVDSYPAYYGYRAGFEIPFSENGILTILSGGVFEHTSTGGRVHYKDYSGEIQGDQTAYVNSYGGLIDFRFRPMEEFSVSLNLSIKYSVSSLKYKLYSSLGSESHTDDYTFKSSSFGIEYGFMPAIHISRFHAGLFVSYFMHNPSGLESEQQPGAFLVDQSGQKVDIDWSGPRIGGILGVEF